MLAELGGAAGTTAKRPVHLGTGCLPCNIHAEILRTASRRSRGFEPWAWDVMYDVLHMEFQPRPGDN